MNLNFVKSIFKFNQEAGLLDKGYSDEKECAFPIEEALEGFDLEHSLTLDMDTPKAMSRQIMRWATELQYNDDGQLITDVDRLDKHLDIIVYSFGSIFKLGLSPQQALRCLDIVMQANMTKLHAGQDSHGKQQKPEGFVGPEAQLQKILDERK